MADATRGYAHRIDVRVPAMGVWRALTEPKLLRMWCARETRVDARAGGSHWVRIAGEFEREAHIDVFEAPRRLRLIYLASAAMPSDGAVLVDDFLLAVQDEITVLRLLGSGVPEAREWDQFYAQLRADWEKALKRLKLLLDRAPAGLI